MTGSVSPLEAKKVPYHEPSTNLSINIASPNSTRHVSPIQCTSTDYTGSPGSYNSYSSADFSSVGGIASKGDNAKLRALRSGSLHHTDIKLDDSMNGHGLLSEVLKMQGLLEEYQHALTALEIEKADKQQEINKLDKQLKGKGETEERYKDEIWNLELNKQELLQKIYDLSQNLSRASTEQTRLAREEIKLSHELEQLKAVRHTWEAELKQTQEQHEQDTIGLKKMLHTLRLEKDQLSKQLQESAVTQQAAQLRHIDTDAKQPKDEDRQDESKDVPLSARSEYCSQRSSNNKSNAATIRQEAELNALKTSLDQAHGIIQAMQEKLDREREERAEVDKLLREAQETIEQIRQNQANNASTDVFSIHSPQQSPSRSAQSSPKSIHSPIRQKMSKLLQKTQSRRSSRAKHPTPQKGLSLCDELSFAGSIGNLESAAIEMNSNGFESNTEKQQEMHIKNDIKQTLRCVTLSSVTLPPISNHEAFSPSASVTSYQDSQNSELSEQYGQQHSQYHSIISPSREYYGTLISKPTSYYYKSKKHRDVAIKTDKKKTAHPSLAINFGDDGFSMNTNFDGTNQEDEDDTALSAGVLTRTMIGDWMWKYTRKVVGSGISENKHRRFFWIHPYTQTLYWSVQKPGNYGGECNTKSILVESFAVLPPHEKSKLPSIFIKTVSRDIQIQCLDIASHYAWVKSLRYLLSDMDHAQYVIPTLREPKNGNIILDKERFSSLRQKSSFSKDKDVTVMVDKTNYYSSMQDPSLLSPPTLFNNSTLVDLRMDQRPFIDLDILK